MSSLLPPSKEDAKSVRKAEVSEVEGKHPEAKLEEVATETEDKKGDVVASFEETSTDVKTKGVDDKGAAYEPASFLRKYQVSSVNVENLVDQPFDKKSSTNIERFKTSLEFGRFSSCDSSSKIGQFRRIFSNIPRILTYREG